MYEPSNLLVTGETKQVATIMDELMNSATMNEGGSTLFSPDKIDQQKHQ